METVTTPCTYCSLWTQLVSQGRVSSRPARPAQVPQPGAPRPAERRGRRSPGRRADADRTRRHHPPKPRCPSAGALPTHRAETPHGGGGGSRGAGAGARHPRAGWRVGPCPTAPLGEPLPRPFRERPLRRPPPTLRQGLSGTGAALPGAQHMLLAAPGPGPRWGQCRSRQWGRRSPSACGATPATGTRSSSTIDSRLAWHRKCSPRGPFHPALYALLTQRPLGAGTPGTSRLRAR